MYLHAIQNTQGDQKTLAKITTVFGLICLVASTYSVLSVSDHSHHEPSQNLPSTIKPLTILVKTLPNASEPVVGPIQAVKTKDLKVDADVENKQVKEATQKPTESKTDKPIEGKRKIEEIREKAAQRKEPALPHPPDDKLAEELIGRNEKGADPVNEKRQLMSTNDGNQSPDDTHDDRNLSSKLDTPLKLKLRAAAEKIDSTDQNIEKKIKKLQEKKAQVESDLKSLQNLKKSDSRERRDLDKKPEESVEKTDGIEEVTDASPIDKKISTSALPSNMTDIHIVGPNSSSTLLFNPTTDSKIPAEVTNAPIVANVSEEVVKGRELKSNDVVGRTLKSKDTLVNKKDSKRGNVGGYSNLWGKRLAKQRSLRANRLNKVNNHYLNVY